MFRLSFRSWFSAVGAAHKLFPKMIAVLLDWAAQSSRSHHMSDCSVASLEADLKAGSCDRIEQNPQHQACCFHACACRSHAWLV